MTQENTFPVDLNDDALDRDRARNSRRIPIRMVTGRLEE
jgi:hypothetical protein